MYKATTLLLISMMILSLLAACSGNTKNEPAANNAPNSSEGATANEGGNAPETEEPLKLTFFDKNTGDTFTNDVAKEITKRTGITLEIQQPTGNPAEKLNLMLASNDLPDIILMDRGSDIVNKYIAAGAILPLNDLIDELGPDIKTMYGDTLKKTRYKDGKNYYLSNWYGLDKDPVFGMNIRQDILRELAPDKADGGVPFTTDEYLALLKAFKAKYPQIDGKNTVPITMNAENMGAMLATFKGMWGMKTYYEDNGQLKFDVKDPRYLEMLLYMNKLYTEGLMDKDWAISKKQTWEQKLSNGFVFSSPGAYWDVGASNTSLKKAGGGEEKQLFAYKVVAPGTDPAQTTFGPRGTMGWDAIAISKTNKDPERTMKLINFLASEEGQYLLLWGIEGVHWDMKDGKHVPKPELIQQFKEDWDATAKKTGVRKWAWFIKNGNGSDGTPYDMPGKYDRGTDAKMATKSLLDSVWDSSPYDNLGPEGGTPDSLINQKIQDIFKQQIPKIIISASANDAKANYDKMLADMKAAGDEKIEKIINEKYQERLELWK
ncbi:ABC transporter substrate-binding protein [Paenibacillus swuensis]|uniref:ABC transporter substrate-binding protein n=2 Tax=Paenibacillus swuensis TaxID=1178515 RepID=A0A172TNU0_9BACL|nr:ABC transporter substrate-binding protein [Paenibacillus swuensis]